MMRAAWYERQGPARSVLQVGELPVPEPGPGEVRVRVAASGIHVGDTGKRQGRWGSTMAFPRVVPHGDGAGVVDAVGPGVEEARVGERVWVFLAQSYRPGGTAAEYTTVPAEHAVPLPDGIPFEQAAGLGIPGITGHRAVFAGGPVAGRNVLVTGAVGAVGRAAVAAALRGGATVVAGVRSEPQLEQARALGAQHAVLTGPGMAARIAEAIGRERLDLAADVAFDADVGEIHGALRYGGEIATYASVDPEPRVPFWPLGFKNVTVRFLSNDDFPEEANQHAARDLTAALADGTLHYPVRARYPLDRIAEAHEGVERGSGTTRVILEP